MNIWLQKNMKKPEALMDLRLCFVSCEDYMLHIRVIIT